jgi:hypothetical protein
LGKTGFVLTDILFVALLAIRRASELTASRRKPRLTEGVEAAWVPRIELLNYINWQGSNPIDVNFPALNLEKIALIFYGCHQLSNCAGRNIYRVISNRFIADKTAISKAITEYVQFERFSVSRN